MKRRSRKGLTIAAILGSTALTLPSIALADTPAPKFTSPDDHGVDLTTGLPFLTIEEGGIGSGPGRVAMQRIWAEGAGWADNWTGGLYPVTSGGVTKMYVQFAGISDTFSGSGASWTADKGDGATLAVDAQGYWNYTGRDGTVIRFDIAKTDVGVQINSSNNCPGADPLSCQVPLSITSPSGLKFRLAWGVAHLCEDRPGEPCAIRHTYQRLSEVSSSAGYSLTISYLSSVIGAWPNPNPNWFTRTSIALDNSVTHPSPPPTIAYGYGTNSISVTDPASRTWTFTLDSSNRLTGIERPGSSSNNVSYVYGADGTVSSATKDGVTNGYGRTISGATATETVTDPLTHRSVTTSDLSLDQPTSYKDELNRMTSYAYDTNARLTKLTYPDGNYNQYAYDGRGNLTTLTKVAKSGSGLANIVTSASFDSTCGNVVTCNQPNSTTAARGDVTTYTYDPTHGGVTTVTQPAPTTGAVQPQTRYSYTQVTSATGDLVYRLTGVSACQTTASCTGGSDETKITAAYNSNLLPTSVTRSDGTGALSATSAMTYDSHGNLLTVDGPLLGTADTTAYKYDSADQFTGAISPAPGNGQPDRAVRLTYRPDGQVSKKELGTVTDQSDTAWANFSPLQTLDVTFDTNSRPVKQALSAGGTTYAMTQTNYDALGRVNCTAVRTDPAQWDGESNACLAQSSGPYGPDRVTQVVYDAAGQVTDNLVGVNTGAAATERHLTYNPNGTVASLLDGGNNLTSYVYDGFDRLSQTQYPSPTKGSGTSNAADYELLTYDANSNVYSRRVRSGDTIAYRYDALNRLTLISSSALADRSFTWDNLGRLLTAKYNGSGQGVANAYDALSRLTSSSSDMGGTAEAMSYGYDLAGRRTSITYPTATGSPNLTVNYSYLTTGEVGSIMDGTTSLASYTYDALGNRASVTYGNGVKQTYAYDPVSRLTSLTADLAGTASDLTKTFGYDPASGIASETRSNTAYSVIKSNVSETGAANGLNQLTSYAGKALGHDANGNVTGFGDDSYTYNVENQLTGATVGGVTTTLTYDPPGRLFQTVVAGTTTKLAYDGLDRIAEYDGAGALLRRYVFDPTTDQPVVWYEGSGTADRRFLISDERGSVIGASDSSGASLGLDKYDEYGQPESSNLGAFGYTGQAWLPSLGMWYYKARFYSPAIGGTFMQTDPMGYNGDGPNLYAYVGNDPVNYVDPLGLAGGGTVGQEIVVFGKLLPINPEPNLWPGGSSRGNGGGGGGGGVGPEIVVTGKRIHQCPNGARLTFGGGQSITGFLLDRGASVGWNLGLAIPAKAFVTGDFRGTQIFISVQFTRLTGIGAFFGAGYSPVGGASAGPIHTGSGANRVYQAGAAWENGGEVSIPQRISHSSSGNISGGPRAGYGGYIAAGRQFNVTVASPQIGCS